MGSLHDNYVKHQYFLYSMIVVFNVFGLFGNYQLIALHIRKPALRTKYGILLTCLTSVQSFCLVCEWMNIGFGVAAIAYGYVIRRGVCFRFMFIYVFAYCVQATLLAVISVDFLISILFPIKHRQASNLYLAVLASPALVYGAVSVGLGFYYLDNDVLAMCNPPSSMYPTVTSFWFAMAFLAGIVTLIAYISGFLVIYLKSKSQQSVTIEKKAMQSLKVLVLVYVVTYFGEILFINCLHLLGVDDAVIVLVQDYVVIFALMSYSQNGYVCFFRSSEYRRMLAEQMCPLVGVVCPCCLPRLQKLKGESITVVQSYSHGRSTQS